MFQCEADRNFAIPLLDVRIVDFETGLADRKGQVTAALGRTVVILELAWEGLAASVLRQVLAQVVRLL